MFFDKPYKMQYREMNHQIKLINIKAFSYFCGKNGSELTIAEKQDHVTVKNRSDTVGNSDKGTFKKMMFQSLLNQVISVCVN